jgi:drug/metabolite transporter (DMT)-like permease
MKHFYKASITLAFTALQNGAAFTAPFGGSTTHQHVSALHMAGSLAEETIRRKKRNPNVASSLETSLIDPTTIIQKKESVPIPDDALSNLADMVLGSGTAEYKRGLLTIGFITLLFSSNSPAIHAAFSGADPPPVLLLNAAVSAVALMGLVVGGESLESSTPLPSTLQEAEKTEQDALALTAGCELGLWKFMGTTANLYGLALTTAGHGALLIQLTTLIVPIVQGLMGVPISKRIQFSVGLALAGVVCFTQDPTGTPSAMGDELCVLAAAFYATYDLRLFEWGKKVAPRTLITSKIGTQALLSTALLLAVGWQDTVQYLSADPNWVVILPVVLWSGVAVNAVAPFLQVGGQQAVGPTRCQTIYASQPLWAAGLSFVFLGETVGFQGLMGGTAFLSALFLAATAEAPGSSADAETR